MTTSKINKRENANVELAITIPQINVKEEYERVLKGMVDGTELAGFRKGKAPKELVEKQADKSKLYQRVLENLLPGAFREAVSEHNLKPIVDPRIEIISMTEDKDWEFKVLVAEKPEVELGNYKEEVQKETGKGKIWVPGKGEKEEQKESEEQKLQKVFDALLRSTKVTVPSLLLESEVNRMLAKLIEQTGKLGLTVEQYLNSTGKNIETVKQEYKKEAEQSLKLELILDSIATANHLEPTDADIQNVLSTAPDEQTRSALSTPEQKLYLATLIRKRKTIDFLLGL